MASLAQNYWSREWIILTTYIQADAETTRGLAVGILFHVYNAPECICFEFEFVYVDTFSEISSSPIFLKRDSHDFPPKI